MHVSSVLPPGVISVLIFTFRRSVNFVVHCVRNVQGRLHTAARNALPNIVHLRVDDTQKNRWELLAHPRHSLDIVPSECLQFRFVKNYMRGHQDATNEALRKGNSSFSRTTGIKLYRKGDFQTSKTVGKNTSNGM